MWVGGDWLPATGLIIEYPTTSKCMGFLSPKRVLDARRNDEGLAFQVKEFQQSRQYLLWAPIGHLLKSSSVASVVLEWQQASLRTSSLQLKPQKMQSSYI